MDIRQTWCRTSSIQRDEMQKVQSAPSLDDSPGIATDSFTEAYI
jgi:hypothetical protein